MNVIETGFPGLLVLEPKVFGDARGFFMESWNQRVLDEAIGKPVYFVQDNHSRSAQGVLRGLHYQLERPQGKLVRVASGAVFDAVVDLRRQSPTFGRHFSIELSEYNKRMLWIPEGFAHGFVVLSDSADFLYKATDYYHPASEHTLAWNNPSLAIAWPSTPEGGFTISDKDSNGAAFNPKGDYFP
jgi:dTDP-4-dehydrorhamnose 3,5-epimerase